MAADLKPHFQCLRNLGLADDGFEKVDGEWTNLVDVDDDDGALRSSSSSSISGSGQFGDVVLVRYQNKPFALKLFKKALSSDDRERIAYIVYLQKTKQREWPVSLVRYIQGFQFGADADVREALLMDRIDGLSFERMIADKRIPNETAQVVCWMRDVLTALKFLHRNGVAHRDVHEGNIMVSRDGKRAILIDLDLACGAALPSEQCTALCYDKASPKSTPPDLWCARNLVERTVSAPQWFAGDLWGTGSAFAALAMQQASFIANKLPYTQRGTTTCINAFSDASALQKKLDPFIATVVTQFFGDKALQRVFSQMLRANWRERITAQNALCLLEKCGSRAAFSMPLSSAEFQAAVERGEIELTGTYE